jgi:hypothetical protein
MFRPETVSRPEAEGTFAEISKQLKMRGLLPRFFGMLPASITAAVEKEQVTIEAGTPTVGERG